MGILKLDSYGMLILFSSCLVKASFSAHEISAYVDDLLGACESKFYLHKFWRKLAARFKIRDLGYSKSFLGIEINHVPEQQCVALTQSAYILELASKFERPTDL